MPCFTEFSKDSKFYLHHFSMTFILILQNVYLVFQYNIFLNFLFESYNLELSQEVGHDTISFLIFFGHCVGKVPFSLVGLSDQEESSGSVYRIKRRF